MHQIREGFITSALRIENFTHLPRMHSRQPPKFPCHILTGPPPLGTKTASTWRFVHRIAGHVGAVVKTYL